MTYLVDTEILADHLHAVHGATRSLEDALRSGRRVAGSVLTRIELRRGARPHEVAAIDTLGLVVDWVAVDHEIAALAEQHAERFGRTDPAISAIEYVIGATAERLDARLLTRRVERYPMFPDLRSPY